MKKFNALRKWLKKDSDHLRMFDKESRGLYSMKDIKAGERIMEIPEKYILELSNLDKSLETSLHNTNSIFAFYLLLESKKKKSHWKIYIDSFPENLDEYIYYYDKEKLKQLKDTSIMCKAVYNFDTHMKNMKKDYKILEEDYGNHNSNKIDFQDFLKFRIYVCSRIFSYTKHYKEENGMVPYADLLNHSQNPNTTLYYDDVKNVFVVEATRNIKKNSEIYDSYGMKTNVQLIMYYGFSIKNNKFSVLDIVHKKKYYQFDHTDKIDYYGIYDEDMKDAKDDSKESLLNHLRSLLEEHTRKIKNINCYKKNSIIRLYY
jgi:hypothetical protein